VDFDRNGTFDLDEQVVANTAVVNGVNLVTFFPPADAPAGDTWMRVRVSESGNLTPTGVSVGGEVEDFEISVLPIALPEPKDDIYDAVEDTLLVVDALSSQDNLFDNTRGDIADVGLSSQILPVRYFVGTQPSNGTLTVTNELAGEFTYLPNPDFYGEDTFTYRLSTQQNAGPGSPATSTFATVTINVSPVNDLPGAQPQSFTGVEDTTLVITEAELLVGSTGHANPAITVAPQDESDQNLRVSSISAGGVTISSANPGTMATTTEGATISALFDGSGFITQVNYQPALHFNSDNLPLPNGDDRLDAFTYTVQDDGVLILDDGSTFGGPMNPLSASETVSVRVAPTNDAPDLATETVSMTDPDYLNYYATIGATAPTPTEDVQIVIPADFLTSNDVSGPVDADDEITFVRNNDGPVRVVDVSMVDPSKGQITLQTNGDILFVPANDVYGLVEFNYVAEDVGFDEAADGTRTAAPLRTTQTSSIFLEPVNDQPVAFDRFLTIDEVVEPDAPAVLTFTAGDLIVGGGVNLGSPITINGTNITVPDGATMVDGETLTITGIDGQQRVVEFNTSGTASIGTDVLVIFQTTDTASIIAGNLVSALGADGGGGVAVADTVSFLEVASIATDTFATGVSSNSAAITVPDGVALTGGETVTVSDSDGRSVVFEFSETGFSKSNADALVPFTDADTSATVAASLQTALANNGFGSTTMAGAGTEWVVQFVNIQTISIDGGASSQLARSGNILTVPDGVNLVNGETISLDDGFGNVSVVEFNTTGTPAAGTDHLVTFAATDLADAIATNLQNVLRAAAFGVTANGADVTFAAVVNAVDAPPVTSVVTTPSSITVPDGSLLVDGELVGITLADASTVVVEFNTTGVASAGSQLVVQYTAVDSAAAIAGRLQAALRSSGFAATATGDTVDFVTVDTVVVAEVPNVAGDFAGNLPAPFNESEQTLRVVAFNTANGTIDVALDGDGVHTLTTTAGGVLTVEFVGGAFTTGSYAPPIDYNELAPFQPKDFFTYTIEDDGQTTIPSTNSVRDLADERSLFPATVTITVTETNDTPRFTTPTEINILEDSFGQTVPGVISNVLPSLATALDETSTQTVSFEIVESLSTVPAGLMAQLPIITPTGGLTFFPDVDAVGVDAGAAIYVIRGTDSDPNDPRSTDATVTVHVRPVNDAPRFNPAVAGTSDVNTPDDAYAVGRNEDVNGTIVAAPITYTLREDNTQPVGAPPASYFIPLRRNPSVVGYNRVGLLDVFVAGPANELDGTSGGSQVLEVFTSFPAQTAFGGQLTAVTQAGVLVGLNYVPPTNYNADIGGVDSFTYEVRDNSVPGGETYSLNSNTLIADQLTTSNTVQFNMTPVNDRPQFSTTQLFRESLEDGGRTTFNNFAFNISAGPPSSAFDEIDVTTGQDVLFSVTSLTFPQSQASQFFTEFPTITPEGVLSYQGAPDVFGNFTFEVVLTDNGPGNGTRGDLISSFPVTMTIALQPVNDAPVVKANADPLEFTLLEDGSVDILVSGDTVTPGLLDVFLPGPANESQNIVPGGNQSVSLATPITQSTALGGTLTQILDPNTQELIALRYTPRENFVGSDSFIYTVTDDGVTVDLGTNSTGRSDAKFAAHRANLIVLPVNDEPRFSGAGNVVSDEDDGPRNVLNWATNVQAGPPSADDELADQNLTFVITQVTGNANLFSTPPTATLNGDTATLSYESAPDANGVATFEVFLRDDGPTNANINDDNVSDTQVFTIRVNAVNDPPTFTPGGIVTVDEDSGPYPNPFRVWATNVSPGPIDEASQTVRFEVTTPASAVSLFQSLPEIDEDGVLRFTPATNANGQVDLTVTAIDSEEEESNQVTLRIVINEVNDRPVAVTDVFDTTEDNLLTITSDQLLLNDIDPDLFTNPLEVLKVEINTGFSLSGARITQDPVTGDIVYDPTDAPALQALPAFSEDPVNGLLIDSFSYIARDAAGIPSLPITVSLNVEGINDAPILSADTPSLAPNGDTIIRPLDNDTDIDGQIVPSTLQITLQPAFGSLSIAPDGVITYTPFGSFSTEDQFRYTVADNSGARSAEALVTIAANAAPITRDDLVGTFVEEAIPIDVAANDFDPDADPSTPNRGLDLGSIVIVVAPTRGDAVPQSNGTVLYTPEPNFFGTDQFQYAIADTEGRLSEAATVDVRVGKSRLQNPQLNQDVNGDGDVSPQDVLLIINLFANSVVPPNGIPVEPGDSGPPFYDVNGDGFIRPSDILDVIAKLTEQAQTTLVGQGEQILAPSPLLTSSTAQSETTTPSGTVDDVFAVNSLESKTVDASASAADATDSADSDVIDLIVGTEDDDDTDRVSALDAAFGDLI
ncbi:MAG: tandem-95 repeat protein, partial [Pirellulaceae bacterium]|nr:tandem-95 repeat protein [Pirellulaceae bacterium]